MPRLRPSQGLDKSALPAISFPLVCLAIGLLSVLLGASCAPPEIEITKLDSAVFLDEGGHVKVDENSNALLLAWLTMAYPDEPEMQKCIEWHSRAFAFAAAIDNCEAAGFDE